MSPNPPTCSYGNCKCVATHNLNGRQSRQVCTQHALHLTGIDAATRSVTPLRRESRRTKK